jgi:3-isopropylmalate/(R)-2-methylmalate dehydratase large subunit
MGRDDGEDEMSQTLVQQIVQAHSGDGAVSPQMYVTVRPDLVVTRDVYWPQIEKMMAEVGTRTAFDKERVIVCFDHMNSNALSPPYVNHYASARRWVREQELEHFYDIGRGGLAQVVIVENGHVNRPGMLVVTEENNFSNIGVFGCLNLCVGWDVFVSIVAGEDYMRVPESVLIKIEGAVERGVTIRDLGQTIRREVQTRASIVDKAIEYTGSGIGTLTLDQRQTLLAMTASWDIGVMEPDELALDALGRFGAEWEESSIPRLQQNAPYAEIFDFDMSNLEPVVAIPGDMTTAVPIGEVEGREIDVASIGSCAGSRYEDLEMVAEVLRGTKIHPRVRLNVTPATVNVLRRAREQGLISVIEEAGGTIFPPGCGQCFGYVGGLADGEVCVTTTQVNARGRMGSDSAEIYLGSPYTVAAAAVSGRLVDARSVVS